MKNIKTSDSVKHYCRLNSSGALTHRCIDQCTECIKINQKTKYEKVEDGFRERCN